jgi:L-alanine-DL-glutamate epimerase-like enolase superfamily enzyme
MSKATDVVVREVFCSFESVPFRTPLKFGGRIMDRTTLVNIDVRVETKSGKKGSGAGSMPIGSVWAWPSAVMTPEQTDAAMRVFAEDIVDLANAFGVFCHPLDLLTHLSGEFDHQAKQLAKKHKQAEPAPVLAQLVATSALDAALHDAYGRVHGLNCFDTLTSKFMNHDLSEYLDATFKGEYLDKYTSRQPRAKLPLYHLVGALDPLTPADVSKKVGDGLPEALIDWVKTEGLTHLKIKLAGDDLAWDVARVLAVEAAVTEAKKGVTRPEWVYSLDFNEKCGSVEYVLDFFAKVRAASPAAYDRVQYVEQPTHRDLAAHPENKMHAAAKLKPVVIDESLVDYDSLLLARELGYSGVALKACKGHGESLVLAAAAQKLGMFLCVQDLTCPGASFLHSASLASRIPGVVAIEGNGRQYCPSANAPWKKLVPSMFKITDGTVGTEALTGPGLGF